LLQTEQINTSLVTTMKFVSPKCKSCKSKDDSLFNVCQIAETEQLNSAKTSNLYKKGQYIFYENAAPVGLFCLSSGAVKLSKLSSNGKEQIVRIARPGDFLGYRSLISKARYTYSAIAIEDAAVCLIPKPEFFTLIRNNNQFYESLMQLICKEADEMEAKIGDIAYKPVRGRIAEALVLLAGACKDSEYITLTREDLASLVGTVKETAIRIISEFKDEKIIEIDKRRIRILNQAKLMAVCNLYD
jgi:CRP/FNR family transcriptional regulator, polysaccharide utilization system transcription regulator